MGRDHRWPVRGEAMMEVFLEPAREIEIRWIQKRTWPERELIASKPDGKYGDFKPLRPDRERAWTKATSRTTCGSSASRWRHCGRSWAKSRSRIGRSQATSMNSRRSPVGTFAS